MRGQQTCHRYILGTLRSNDATATRTNQSINNLYYAFVDVHG